VLGQANEEKYYGFRNKQERRFRAMQKAIGKSVQPGGQLQVDDKNTAKIQGRFPTRKSFLFLSFINLK
jgi:hypothetical protein